MEMMVNLTDEEYDALLEKAKEEVRGELTQEAIEKYIHDANHMYLMDLFRNQINIYTKYEALEDKKVKELTANDVLIFILYHLMYNKLVH